MSIERESYGGISSVLIDYDEGTFTVLRDTGRYQIYHIDEEPGFLNVIFSNDDKIDVREFKSEQLDPDQFDEWYNERFGREWGDWDEEIYDEEEW